MKKLSLLFILTLVLCSIVSAQNGELNIIPQPKSIEIGKGNFKLNYKTKIVIFEETGRKSAVILNEFLMKNYGFKLEITETPQKKNAIFIFAGGIPINGLPPADYAEGYRLSVFPKSINITASETGQFYALQTLMQILPPEFKGEIKIPVVYISDAPRFPYRGMHLDVGRHFMPVEFVKKYIDLMAQYKFGSTGNLVESSKMDK